MKKFLASIVIVTLAVLTAAPVVATGATESTEPPAGAEPSAAPTDTAGAAGPRYATGFSYEQHNGYTLVTVTIPWQGATADDERQYLLYPRGTRRPPVSEQAVGVEIPAQSIVTMSTTFLPHVEMLNSLDVLAAHDSLAWIYSPAVRERADDGLIAEVGSGSMVDIEKLVELDPDAIFTNSYGGEWDAHPLLDRAGLPTVISGDWVEQTPLGRAEWLIFTALFLDKLDLAQQVFAEIEAEYTRLQALAAGTDERPSVLINAPYQGTWSVAGGESYAAALIADAGGDYVWADDAGVGAIFLDIETVFAEAGTADVWINPGMWSSLSTGLAEDARFAGFASFRNGEVYNNNARVSDTGGIDYFESGAANPQVVLADLIRVFHPGLMPGYEPFYYQKLE